MRQLTGAIRDLVGDTYQTGQHYRVRGGVRGLALIGGSTGDPAGPEHNVTAGIEWDDPADMTHASNAVLAISHRVRIP